MNQWLQADEQAIVFHKIIKSSTAIASTSTRPFASTKNKMGLRTFWRMNESLVSKPPQSSHALDGSWIPVRLWWTERFTALLKIPHTFHQRNFGHRPVVVSPSITSVLAKVSMLFVPWLMIRIVWFDSFRISCSEEGGKLWGRKWVRSKKNAVEKCFRIGWHRGLEYFLCSVYLDIRYLLWTFSFSYSVFNYYLWGKLRVQGYTIKALRLPFLVELIHLTFIFLVFLFNE